MPLSPARVNDRVGWSAPARHASLGRPARTMTDTRHSALALLAWYIESGVDEAIATEPRNFYQPAPTPPAPAPKTTPALERRAPRPGASVPLDLESPAAAQDSAQALAAAAGSLSDLAEAMQRFEGCALKHTASNLVFGDGNPEAQVMFVGEAPGADEDRQGKPFVGVSGQLLDRMIACIGLDRGNAYITNIISWRPPGNRKPTTAEVTTCLPFIQRHIELVAPHLLVLVGGTAVTALTGRSQGITRLRGRWLDYQPANAEGKAGNSIAALPIFHPAYLLRQPALKREAWRDLLAIRERLSG